MLVVSDEAYDRLLYDGLEHRSIASEPGMRDRTVILGSFSKTYSMTGWRIGYLAGPAEVIRGMALLQQSFVLSVNSFAQWGAVEAMTGPQDCVEEMRQQFDIRRKAMMEALSTIPNVSFAAPKGAFYIYLNHEKTGLDPVQFCAKLLDEYYVACVPVPNTGRTRGATPVFPAPPGWTIVWKVSTASGRWSPHCSVNGPEGRPLRLCSKDRNCITRLETP